MYQIITFITMFTSLFVTMVSSLPTFDTNVTLVDLDKRAFVGTASWYHVGLGNCGKTNQDTEAIVAIAKSLYDSNGGAYCDRMVEITNLKNGKKAYGQIEDSCQSCRNEDLDLSPSLFAQLDDPGMGRIQISWDFLPLLEDGVSESNAPN